MDQARFDRIARALGATATRRAGIAAALAVAVAAAGTDDARGKKKKCKPKCVGGFSCVKKRCVCKSEIACGDACCASGQYCDAAGACAPVPTGCTVCASGCPYTTIRAAIANDRGATITVAPGRYVETDLAIDRDVTIAACAPGGASPNVIVDARREGRVFTVGFDRTVTLRGLAVAGGRSGMAGGCISNFGSLTLEGCTVGPCESANAGGAISSTPMSRLTLDATRVSGNLTADAMFGGAIVADGELRIVNGSRVEDNQAGFSGGGVYFGGTTMLLEGSSVAGNLLTGPEALGGGVYVAGGTATLRDAVIRDNAAGAGAGVHVVATARLELRGETQVFGNAGVPGSAGQGVSLDQGAAVSCEAGPRVCGNPEPGATLATNCLDASGAAFPAACGCAAGACPA